MAAEIHPSQYAVSTREVEIETPGESLQDNAKKPTKLK